MKDKKMICLGYYGTSEGHPFECRTRKGHTDTSKCAHQGVHIRDKWCGTLEEELEDKYWGCRCLEVDDE